MFFMILYMYIVRTGADNPRGQHFEVNRNLLSLRSFATSFKKISLKSNFIQVFHDFIHVYRGSATLQNEILTLLRFDHSS